MTFSFSLFNINYQYIVIVIAMLRIKAHACTSVKKNYLLIALRLYKILKLINYTVKILKLLATYTYIIIV